MSNSQDVEYWMRGPVSNIHPMLQPVAHTFLQVRKEVNEIMRDFPPALLWQKPGGFASPAFHIQHISGVLDRLFTYARSERLSEFQYQVLREEGKQRNDLNLEILLNKMNAQIDISMDQLSKTNEVNLTDFRGVGRKQLPSTVIGLLFHAAEHSMRHTGQLLATAGILRATLR